MSGKKHNIPRTSSGLRDALFDELDALRAGESNPQRAQAVSKLACQVINSVKMEIEFHSHVQSATEGSELPMSRPLKLTTGGGDDK
jgi:hypothetical protein